jgi:putative DNA primase/helicase
MNNVITLAMIHEATSNLTNKQGSAVSKPPSKQKTGQSPLPFPAPVYLNAATVQAAQFSNPPAPSPIDVETACPAIKELARTGGTTEEQWSLGLINTARFTDDPEAAAHAWSKAYPTYDQTETDQKLVQKSASSSGPTTCARIGAFSPECATACLSCPYNGKATTPIHAAQKYVANRGILAAVVGTVTATTGSDAEVNNDQVPPVLDPTDAGNAKWLWKFLQGRVRFVSHQNRWMIFEAGKGWGIKTDPFMLNLAEQAMRELGCRAMTELHPHDLQKSAKHVTKSLNATSLMNAVTLLKGQPSVEVQTQALDANPMLLGLKKGKCLDLTTGMVFEAEPQHLITKSAGCEFDPFAKCPMWEAFLLEVFEGDRDLIDYLQQWVGYCLSGSISEQQILFAYGLGANGKSVLFSVLVEMFGTYAVTAPVETFMLNGNEGPKSFLLARLAGARLVLANETADSQRLAENTIKELTGGEVIAAAHKYGHVFEYRPSFKIAIVGNHKPVIKGTDTGIWRRLHMLPFNRTFTGQEQDPDLVTKLKTELSGILNWAVKGALAWQQSRRLKAPDAMRKEADKYRTESDIIGQWLTERCRVKTGLHETAAKLYADYSSWCRVNGHHPSSQTILGRRLSERGFTKKPGAKIVWSGLGLQPPCIPAAIGFS